ncbi:hypothetical protein SAMN05444166_4784 [Singulisphaera sp. GP187]|nr:hypothetical protein SAMN05444166_4784 [Singulisphaera sp. GP187]
MSGEVKLAGAPLKSGMIQFMPTEPGAATPGAAAVTDGKYAMSRAVGLVPGPYQVSVTSAPASSTTPSPNLMPGDPVPPAKEPIPSIYNAKTTLSATVTEVGPNTFDFELDATASASAPTQSASQAKAKAKSKLK